MASIAYCITVADEHKEISRLLSFKTGIMGKLSQGDRIYVLADEPKITPEVRAVLGHHVYNRRIGTFYHTFENDFASWKNRFFDFVEEDYIFQIDADELVSPALMEDIKLVVDTDLDLYYIPRENTVEGLTQEHIRKWRWRVDEQGRVNFPDYQGRLYKNAPHIRWKNKVHEVISGHKDYAYLPDYMCLLHPKDIERQERQNAYYGTLG